MKGDIAAALGEFRAQYEIGADPAVILTDLAEFTHLLTRFKVLPATADDRSLIEAERKRGREMAAGLSIQTLSRAWQMLTKGIFEVQGSGKPAQAAEMVLVRLAYAADLPTPDEALKAMREGDEPVAVLRRPRQALRWRPATLDCGGRRRDGARDPATGPPARSIRQGASRIGDARGRGGACRGQARHQAQARGREFLRLVRMEEGRLEVAFDARRAVESGG